MIILFVTLMSSRLAFSNPLTPKAQEMYEKYNAAVLQVRVVAKGSGEKSTLGSGFFFTPDGLVATNYHVVSDAVNYPNLFVVEYILQDGQRGPMEVMNIDPVHDLVILKIKGSVQQFFSLGNSNLSKGMKIFSFGNPYDFGLIIAEGLYNGILEHARYRKILFSGSLNPGMSGGPAVGTDGSVLGINVSSSGNEISFFVPVEYLQALYEEIQANKGSTFGPYWIDVIRKSLVLDEEDFLEGILVFPSWNKRRIGMANVPGEISNAFRCWGQSGDNKKYWMIGTYLTCSSNENIFLSQTMSTGEIHFYYQWYESRDDDPARFYNLYEQFASATQKETLFENVEDRDAGNFVCDQGFVNVDKHRCKVDFCSRRYKAYEGLYDVAVQITLVDMMNKGLIINIFVSGVTDIQSKRFLLKLLNEIKWQK